MVNDYGIPLDKNGYAPSILPVGRCYICRCKGTLVRHEVYHGPNRQKSKALGLWVELCPSCHWKVHNGTGELDRWLRRTVQPYAMKCYGWSIADFIRIIGKNFSEG